MEKKLKIHCALPMRPFIGEPATVVANGSRDIQVGCGKGSLLLIQVQLERKRAMPATQFVRGFSLPAGTRFPQAQTVP
jgi:methionyl-tRNA formyltransferase